MPDKINGSFVTLSIELVYRILDKLDKVTLLCSVRNVCTRLNAIIETYDRFKVSLMNLLK